MIAVPVGWMILMPTSPSFVMVISVVDSDALSKPRPRSLHVGSDLNRQVAEGPDLLVAVVEQNTTLAFVALSSTTPYRIGRSQACGLGSAR